MTVALSSSEYMSCLVRRGLGEVTDDGDEVPHPVPRMGGSRDEGHVLAHVLVLVEQRRVQTL